MTSTLAIRQGAILATRNRITIATSALIRHETILSRVHQAPMISSVYSTDRFHTTESKTPDVVISKVEGASPGGLKSFLKNSNETEIPPQPPADITDDSADDVDDDEMEQEEMFVQPHSSLGHEKVEWGGPTRGGRYSEPTRFGDWERKGRCTDF
jgi:hypothetical protein